MHSRSRDAISPWYGTRKKNKESKSWGKWLDFRVKLEIIRYRYRAGVFFFFFFFFFFKIFSPPPPPPPHTHTQRYGRAFSKEGRADVCRVLARVQSLRAMLVFCMAARRNQRQRSQRQRRLPTELLELIAEDFLAVLYRF